MVTQATKRRRLETASKTLKKPFRSPLINRETRTSLPASNTSVSSRHNKTPIRTPSERVIRWESPLERGDPPSFLLPVGTSGEISTPTIRPKRLSLTSRSWAVTAREQGTFLAAITSYQREVARDIKHLDDELESVGQAKRLVEVTALKTPGRDPGSELDDLTQKWKAAARQAADELFPTAKGRFERMGGSKGIREMQQRQAAFLAGLDAPPHGNGCRESEEDDKAEDQVEDDHEFTMGIMLRSMNIEFDTIGYGSKEDAWID